MLPLLKWVILIIIGYIVLQQIYLLLECGWITLHGVTEDRVRIPTIEDLLQLDKTNDPDKIPRVIHQTWKNANLSSYPNYGGDLNAQWIALYGQNGWEVKLWTDADIKNLIQTKYRLLLESFNSYTYPVEQADIARLLIVHAEGGFYMDLDTAPKSLPSAPVSLETIRKCSCAFPIAHGGSALTNHFFGCEKDSQLLSYILHRSTSSHPQLLIPYLHVFLSTGPLFITQSILEYLSAFPKDNFVVLSMPVQNQLLAHFPGRSWIGADGMLFNYLADNSNALLVTIIIILIICIIIIRLILRRRLLPQ